MFRKKYHVFQKIEEAKSFCQQSSRIEKRQLLSDFIGYQEPSKYQNWAAPSIYYLRYLLNGLYDLDEAYSKYDELSFLQKHGVAHLIISLSAPYCENLPAILLGESNAVPSEYILYVSVKEYKKKKVIYMFTISTCEKKTLTQIPMDLGIDELKMKLQDKIGNNDFHINETIWEKFDPEDIDYFGNYIHQKVKDKMGHIEEWKEIKILRNRLAHPHEGISEQDLKRACGIVCEKNFIEDIEALVFLLSPLLPEDRQKFCQHGYHDYKEEYICIAHGICRTNA